MQTKRTVLLAATLALSLSSLPTYAVPFLSDYGFNIDGAISLPLSGDPLPAVVDISLFDEDTGLGTITATISGAGSHNFDVFFDHDLDNVDGDFADEFGSVTGAPFGDQSWEIDEPGFTFGDIFDNFLASNLDNTNGVPALSEDDVSMAMGWDFSLAIGQTAEITLSLTEVAPTSGFYLAQTDASGVPSEFLYFQGSIALIDPRPVPEPSMLYLMGIGMLGFVVNRRRKIKA